MVLLIPGAVRASPLSPFGVVYPLGRTVFTTPVGTLDVALPKAGCGSAIVVGKKVIFLSAGNRDYEGGAESSRVAHQSDRSAFDFVAVAVGSDT